MYSTKRLQTGDGINFANLPGRCSGNVESTNASHDTPQHLSKSMMPLSPHAMLTSNFRKWICEIYSVQTSPCVGHLAKYCHDSTLQRGERGERADHTFLQLTHLRRFAKFIPSTVPGHGLNGCMMASLRRDAQNVKAALLNGSLAWFIRDARGAGRFALVFL